MSEMKSGGKRMNHVFNEMTVKAGRDIDTAELQFINGGVSATFFCTQQAIHAAHAINNHDRMVEEIAELREALSDVIDGCSEYDLNYQTGLSIARCQEIMDISEKPNKEGEK